MPHTTGGRLQLPWPDIDDGPADVPDWLSQLANALEGKGLVLFIQSTAALRPAAGTQGRLHKATDTGTISYDDGSTWTDINLASSSGNVPVGAELDWPWAASSAPANFGLQYGQAISRATYSVLNAIALASSYPYGAGDGSTTFNIADKRGRVNAGKDDMGGSAASRLTNAVSGVTGTTLGFAAGAQGITLSTAQIPAHNHGMTDPGHHHQNTYAAEAGHDPSAGGANGAASRVTRDTDNASTGISSQNTGGGGAHANVQPTIIVNKLIRLS